MCSRTRSSGCTPRAPGTRGAEMAPGSRKFFLRDGREVDEGTWRVQHSNPDYIRIAETTVSERLWVSTVWTGIDHDQHEPALIFETAVFDPTVPGMPRALDEAQYATEAEALAGHAAMVERWKPR